MAGMMEVTGRIISTVDLARRYGLTDIDGSTPMDLRCEELIMCRINNIANASHF